MGNCLSASTLPTEPNADLMEEGVKVFTVADLKKATNDFGNQMELGESLGYINPKTLSPAKKGVGMAVAVKKIYLANEQAFQDWLVSNYIISIYRRTFGKTNNIVKFLVDVEFLRNNSHPSLVKLIGYCYDRDMLFIVSEYFPNGSLGSYISREGIKRVAQIDFWSSHEFTILTLDPIVIHLPFGFNGLYNIIDSRPKSLPWETRLKISIGAAQCLAFLHSRKQAGLYRRYLTASKILLDSDFNARVSYFGKPKVSLDELVYTIGFSNVAPRYQYPPPEYILSGNNLLLLPYILKLKVTIKFKETNLN
ncbi:putative transferase, protein kinase RLK-Pelle-RLCK-VIIa-2 family [Arabidopsis thaliana]